MNDTKRYMAAAQARRAKRESRPLITIDHTPIRGLLPEEIEAFYAGVEVHRTARTRQTQQSINRMRRRA